MKTLNVSVIIYFVLSITSGEGSDISRAIYERAKGRTTETCCRKYTSLHEDLIQDIVESYGEDEPLTRLFQEFQDLRLELEMGSISRTRFYERASHFRQLRHFVEKKQEESAGPLGGESIAEEPPRFRKKFRCEHDELVKTVVKSHGDYESNSRLYEIFSGLTTERGLLKMSKSSFFRRAADIRSGTVALAGASEKKPGRDCLSQFEDETEFWRQVALALSDDSVHMDHEGSSEEASRTLN